jgi:hypothetical protein
MNLFQESENIEAFERKLNEPDSRINNLDLNGDNLVDYIMVNDYVDHNVHNIALQVAISPEERQDVAVFTVQRFNNGEVQIQLVGDEDLYGRNYIIEPNYAVAETANPGYRGRHRNVTVIRTTYLEIAAWPMVRFIYEPYYTVWHSSWYWGYYPSYWHPWTPFYYHYYYGYHHNLFPVYYSHYRHCDQLRYTGYHDFYYSNHRAHSVQVVSRINQGQYKKTYSRPEQRREGEALYARTHSERSSNYSGPNRSVDNRTNSTNARSTGRNSSSGNVRREAASVNNSRNSTTGSPRRTETNVNRGSGPTVQRGSVATENRTLPVQGQVNNPRRSTVNERPVTERSSGTQNSGRSRESVTRSAPSNRETARSNPSGSSNTRQAPTERSTSASSKKRSSESSGNTDSRSSGNGRSRRN